ncbi:hypothetical protein Pmani_023960 [Petrolisthes manimaculis]|uniref:SET domain-containing protein n=1 Tax=Petrolisthes manimaculis TaxID=1843537 RepID=A0AAE1U2V8_9EUCA|nr:hypothetical protein Pmani_023960 [Petrolisthes manimaculis]
MVWQVWYGAGAITNIPPTPPTTTNDNTNHNDSFSGRLQQEYSSSRRPDIQRSVDASKEPPDVDCCASVALQVSLEYGRYLVATRDILAGEELFREVPLVLAPRPVPTPACLACLRGLVQDWRGCEECGAPLCWPRCPGTLHGVEECQSLSSLSLSLGNSQDLNKLKLLNEILTPMRTLLVLSTEPSLRGVVASMQSNVGQRRRLKVGQETVLRVAQTLQEDLDVVAHILGVFDTNAFVMSGQGGGVGGVGGSGRALLPLSALMNHNCTPNTQHWFQHGAIIVRAVCDIPRGSQVTTSYAPTLWGTSARAAHLTASKLFRCRCERCRDPTELGSHLSSLACRSCKGGLMVPPHAPGEPWACNQCEGTVGVGAAEALVRGAGAIVRGGGGVEGNEGDVTNLTTTVGHLTRVLGPTHYVTREANYALLLALLATPLTDVSEGDLLHAVGVARDLLGVADLVDPGLSRFRGVLLLELTRACAELLRRQHIADHVVANTMTADVACGISELTNTTTTPSTTTTTPSTTTTTPSTTTTTTPSTTTTTTPPLNTTTTPSPNTTPTTPDTHQLPSSSSSSSSSHTIRQIQPVKKRQATPENNYCEENNDVCTELSDNGYCLDTVQKLLEAADESEVILQFDSRLSEVWELKQLLHQLQR